MADACELSSAKTQHTKKMPSNTKRKADVSEIVQTPKKIKKPSPNLRQWTKEEELQLLEKVRVALDEQENTTGKHGMYLKSLDLKTVTLPGFSNEEIQTKFHRLCQSVRKMRTAREVIEDIKVPSHANRSPKTPKPFVDPNQPKMPLTSYFRYCQKHRAKLAKKYPNLKSTELAAKLSKKWRKMSEERKKAYTEQYEEEKKEYETQLLDFLKNKYPNVEPPLSAFELWANQARKDLLVSNPDISAKKLKKKLKRKWKEIDEKGKKTWIKKEKTEMRKYQKKIKEIAVTPRAILHTDTENGFKHTDTENSTKHSDTD
ncbi:predicted protein [Nematostella vectensis]|uniref:HMG box domain-containing protein n=1 Tax=Nematostella vectensis TaxID=45351 RepID=A7SSV1_NEMVE|nr:predicted protein [Nematostella vectensis]|eukprot:XP_001625304.1 predicted protein [Nematostella vectensis]